MTLALLKESLFKCLCKAVEPVIFRAGHSLLDKRHVHGHQQFLQRPAPPPLRKLFFKFKKLFFCKAQRGMNCAAALAASLAVRSSLLPHPQPSVTAMALSVIVPLLALASFCAAFAPNCDDMVKPYIPQDPKVVRHASIDF